MSGKEKKNFKKFSKRLLASFRKGKKLSQIKEHSNSDDGHTSSCSSSLKHHAETDVESTTSEETQETEAHLHIKYGKAGCSSVQTVVDAEVPSTSTSEPVAQGPTPRISRQLSPGVHRVTLSGVMSASADSGIDCNALLMDKGSPEQFQAFSRREAERLRHEYLHGRRDSGQEGAIADRHTLNGIREIDGETTLADEGDVTDTSANGSLLEQINQTKEQINLLSELKTVLAKKLESCRLDSSIREIPDTNGGAQNTSLEGAISNSPQACRMPWNTNNPTENFVLNSLSNKTDEAKTAEARFRRANESVLSQGNNLLQIDSPHKIVSPIPIMSASLANNKTLPSTPSPARTFLNENGAFAKCKSIRRSVSDVGKGLLGKLKHKRKGSDTTVIAKDDFNPNASCTHDELERSQLLKEDKDDSQVGDSSFTIVALSLCNFGDGNDHTKSGLDGKKDISMREESKYQDTSMVSNKTSPVLKEILSPLGATALVTNSPRTHTTGNHRSPVIKEILDNTFESCNPSETTVDESFHELTAGICDMTSALRAGGGSSAESIACICDCKKDKPIPDCCDKRKSPFTAFVSDGLPSEMNYKQQSYLASKNTPALAFTHENFEVNGSGEVKVHSTEQIMKADTANSSFDIVEGNGSFECRPDSYGEESLAEILTPDRNNLELAALQNLHKGTTKLTEQELWDKGMICDLTGDSDSSSSSGFKGKRDGNNEGSDSDSSDCSGDCSDLNCSCCCQDVQLKEVARKMSSSSNSSESDSSSSGRDQAAANQCVLKSSKDIDKKESTKDTVYLRESMQKQNKASNHGPIASVKVDTAPNHRPIASIKVDTAPNHGPIASVKVENIKEFSSADTSHEVAKVTQDSGGNDKEQAPYTVSFKELMLGNGDVICFESSSLDNFSCNETSYGEAMSSPCLMKFGTFSLTPNSSPAGSGNASIDISPSFFTKDQDLNIANFSVECSPTPLNLSRESSLAEISVEMSPTPLNLSQNSSIVDVSVDNNSPRQVEGSEGECSAQESGAIQSTPKNKQLSTAQGSTDSSPTPPHVSASSSIYNVSDDSSPKTAGPTCSSGDPSHAPVSVERTPKPLDLSMSSQATDTSFEICRRKDGFYEYKMAKQDMRLRNRANLQDAEKRTLAQKRFSIPDSANSLNSHLKGNRQMQSGNISLNTSGKLDSSVRTTQSCNTSPRRGLDESINKNISLSESSFSNPPLDLSMSKRASKSNINAKSAAWVEGHVGQVYSPAQRVLHKNRGLSEMDLCRKILDLYVSDAEESGFDDSMMVTMSPNRQDRGLSVEDSMLQYGTYVAPRNVVKETNVDDFTTTTKKTCYTGEAKTRKLQGGSAKGLLGGEDRRRAAQEELGLVGDSNTSMIRQIGDGDTSMTRRMGDANTSMRMRRGDGDTSMTRRMGDANTSMTRRRGDGDTSMIRRRGDGDTSITTRRLNTSRSRQTDDLETSRMMEMLNASGSRQALDPDSSMTRRVLNTSLSRKAVNLDSSMSRRSLNTSASGQNIDMNTSMIRGVSEEDLSWNQDGDLSFGEIIAAAPGDPVSRRDRSAARFVTFGDAAGSVKTRPGAVQGRGAFRDRTNTTKRLSVLKQSSSREDQKAEQKQMKAQRPTNKMGERSFDRLTEMHTVHNGRRKVRCLSMNESLSIVKHYPPPKEASRISWGQTLEELDLYRHSPRRTPVKTRPILTQKENDYPYDEHTPSPIVLTKMRRPKSQSKKYRNWPWS